MAVTVERHADDGSRLTSHPDRAFRGTGFLIEIHDDEDHQNRFVPMKEVAEVRFSHATMATTVEVLPDEDVVALGDITEPKLGTGLLFE